MINLVSRKANFTPVYHLNTRYGSWDRFGFTSDINHVFNTQIAARLTADLERGNSWRDDIKYKNFMLSPSILLTNKDGDVSFEMQYTHDNAWRVPDRTPEKSVYDAFGLSYDRNFSHKDDYVRDTLDFFRTEFNAKLINDINLKWVFGYREAY